MIPLEEGKYYHVYNRGINSCDLFLDDKHFLFFLRNYFYYLYPAVETFAYCLMKNHFHFLFRVRTVEEQKQLFKKFSPKSSTEKPAWVPHGYNNEKFKTQALSRQLSHLFNKYSRNFNKWTNRTGKLFEQPFKRKIITDESYLIHLMLYPSQSYSS